MAAITSVLESPQAKMILESDAALIAELEAKVEALQEDSRKAHLKATHRRTAIKGLERRAEHLEHLLGASRCDTERLNKEEFAARTLLKMCGGNAFAAFDTLLESAFGGRVDELCEHISELDTEACGCGCGEWVTDAIYYNVRGVPLCRTCHLACGEDRE